MAAALVAQAPQNPPPNFKVAVEYVEVDARALDARGNPVPNLTKESFQILEDGVAQDVATFSAIEIPVPAVAPPGTEPRATALVPVVTDTTSNARKPDSARIYLIVFNDVFVTPGNTPEVRRIMRDFVERHVGPEDLVGVLTIGLSRAFQEFTSNKTLLVSAIDRLIGAKELSPTLDNLTNIEAKAAMSPIAGRTVIDRPPAATADKALQQNRSSQQMLVRIAPARPSFAGPSGASEPVREALNSILPMNGLTMSATAAAFRDRGSDASVAVVLEASGADLALTERNGSFTGPLEVLVAALDQRGSIRASDVKQLQFTLARDVFDRVTANGFRWLSRLPLKPGRYQVRIAAATGPARRGSVWYDLEVPDFGAGDISMSGILVTSAAALQTPTVRPDKQLDGVLPGPPTTRRTFPAGDELMVLAEIYDNKLSQRHELDVAIGVRSEQAVERFRMTETETNEQLKAHDGVHRSVTKIPLNLVPGRYTLTIDARRRDRRERGISRAIPFQVQ